VRRRAADRRLAAAAAAWEQRSQQAACRHRWRRSPAALLALRAGKVDVLTNPKSSGYTQNPISVYYCYSKGGQLVKGIAEVRRRRSTPLADASGWCLWLILAE
jgi:DUF1365 family protein